MQQGCKEQRNGGDGKWKKYKNCSERKTKQLRFTNKFINTVLQSRSDKDEGNVI